MPRVAQVTPMPAPIGGLNLVDSLANMEPTEALVLENYVPRGNNIALRKGFTQHASGLTGKVETVMAYNGAIQKLFGIAGGSFFDSTGTGPVGAPLVTGQANSRWEHINVATSGGQFLYAVNGVNSPQIWNGTVWQAVTGVSAPIAITGVTTSTLSHITLHQNRVWFAQTGTLVAFYLGINSVGGLATAFDLRTIAKLGGTLIAIDTWTVDTGSGSDDLMVFITDQGEVLVYAGTDPSSTSTWQLQGVYRSGRPTGKRCSLKVRGDLLILSEGGIISLSDLIQSGIDRASFITYKIQPELGTFLATAIVNYGWEMLYFQTESLGILNSPESDTVTRQYAWDINTRAWCKWTGITAFSLEMFQGSPYLGQASVVSKLWTASSDAGVAITGKVKPAFSRYDYAERKNQRRIRVYFLASVTPVTYGIRMNRDFEDFQPQNITLMTPSSGLAFWDAALWDQALWGGGDAISITEAGVGVIGTYLTPYIITQSKDIEIKINGFDHVWEAAGFTG